MSVKLSELAQQTGSTLKGDGDILIEGVSEISQAKTGDIAFVYHKKYIKHLKSTKASAVILGSELVESCPVATLVSKNPRLTYAKVASVLYPAIRVDSGIASSAVIDKNVEIDKTASIAAGVVICSGAIVKKGVQIDASCVIESGAVIGANSIIKANVTIGHNCTLGEGCILHSGAVIGADGFGFVKDGDSYFKIPQLGSVHIGNQVEIGANTSIDRGALDDTIIGNGVKLDNQIQIAHGVNIGDNTVISAATAIAGSTHIGRNCLIGGLVGIIEHLTIVDNVMITGRTMVTRSITEPGSYSSSTPMDTTENWRKNSARFRRLDDLAKRVAKLEITPKKNNN